MYFFSKQSKSPRNCSTCSYRKNTSAQDDTHHAGGPTTDFHHGMPIIIHGDAAYPGQGINFETMNLSNLNGYSTGGALHIITNNRIGFTTEPIDGRSTTYSSDIAKGTMYLFFM